MRIKTITLSWFRGASDSAVLEIGSKSLVVYGQNGAGKSSFIDAIEHSICDGKVNHLAHEYSGKKQEKGIRNTHTPADKDTFYEIVFKDDSNLKVTVAPNGSSARKGTTTADTATWDYRRTVLRQDEIARFITSTKGSKYSDLLPLLGLGPLETAAENLRQLVTAIEKDSGLREKKGAASLAATQRKQVFGDASDDEITATIATLHATYCPNSATDATADRCEEIITALTARIAALSSENQRHVTLKYIVNTALAKLIGGVREASAKLAGSVEPLIAEKLEVLRSADAYARKLGEAEDIACPACGQSITADDFAAHVKAEQERLREIIAVFNERRTAIAALIDALKALAAALGRSELKSWREELNSGPLQDCLAWIEAFKPEDLRESLDEAVLLAIESNWPPVIASAAKACKQAPPEITQLSIDKASAEAARAAIQALATVIKILRIESLIAFVAATESNIRTQIRTRSERVIKEISSDIGSMWSALHPGEPIEDVRLYLPDDPKAIDIALKFHGRDQDSPRLTLSEGYRNGLGLCIFLAMAKRQAEHERPLFLDDVVVSFDRSHRGMIIKLLEDNFSDRQVIIMTHDRDWYADLRQQLDDTNWSFKSLLPYETPVVGIRWSHKSTTFDDARANLSMRPDAAVNDARKIMDVELGIAAEKLKIKMVYLRGEKNDHRTGVDFLKRFAADGVKSLQKKVGTEYVSNAEALKLFNDTAALLMTWANRGSHTEDVTKSEAELLIDTCEQALAVFKCGSCQKFIWRLDDSTSELVRCDCGEIRWRYGKV
ncbi:MAG: AAA family ATPase [Hyphomicrobium sp.]|nr:AAA family ATPase [Hyphomicrobium sp.]